MIEISGDVNTKSVQPGSAIAAALGKAKLPPFEHVSPSQVGPLQWKLSEPLILPEGRSLLERSQVDYINEYNRHGSSALEFARDIR